MDEPYDECRIVDAIGRGEQSGRRLIVYGRHGEALKLYSTERLAKMETSAKRLRDALWEFLHPAVYDQLKEIFKNER